MKTLVQFGAGNIGRSFVGRIFAEHGWRVVFIDLDRELIDRLNACGQYRVVVKDSGQPDEIVTVEGVRGIDARDQAPVAAALADADLAATAVGKNALPSLAPVLARGLLARRQLHGDRPLDLVLAENVRNGGAIVRQALRRELPSDYPLNKLAGLVETSIGKMVPLMTREALAVDPLWLFAEPYNTLILDRRGFRGQPPTMPELKMVDNIAAYVDRKLFIHNLGHAAAAYLGFCQAGEGGLLWQYLDNPAVLEDTRRVMQQAAAGVAAEYPNEFSTAQLHSHIEDLLRRFRNRALGDTAFRVGLDLRRKLGRHDRIVGAMLLNRRHGLPYKAIAHVLLAALRFRAGDENGSLFPADAEFIARDLPLGLNYVLTAVCGLSPDHLADRESIDTIFYLQNVFDRSKE